MSNRIIYCFFPYLCVVGIISLQKAIYITTNDARDAFIRIKIMKRKVDISMNKILETKIEIMLKLTHTFTFECFTTTTRQSSGVKLRATKFPTEQMRNRYLQ